MKRKTKSATQSGRSMARLVLRIEDEQRRCLERMAIYRSKGYQIQYDFTRGQHDSLGGVLHWIDDAQ